MYLYLCVCFTYLHTCICHCLLVFFSMFLAVPQAGPEIIKCCVSSIQLSVKNYLLIKAKILNI